MLVYQILFGLFGLSVLMVGIAVMGRLLSCAYQAVRASRIKLAAVSVLAIAGVVGLLVAFAAVWFGYAVAHSEKDLSSDLKVALLTGLPFYIACYAFWRTARYLRSLLSGPPNHTIVAGDAPRVARRG